MERRTKSQGRGKANKQCGATDTIQKQSSIVLSGEGKSENLEILSQPISKTTEDRMAESADTLREVGRMVSDVLNRQMELQQQMNEVTSARFTELMANNQASHKRDTDALAGHFDQMRIDHEKARGRQVQHLPKFDGTNMCVDDWIEKTETVSKGNNWGVEELLQNIPVSLAGIAKRAFDSLGPDDKSSIEVFNEAMRDKLDPQAVERNRALFATARRGKNESTSSFVDRLKMYIRRSGGNATDNWALDMLKYKIYENLSPTEAKIVRAAVDSKDSLEKIAMKADNFFTEPASVIGAVIEGDSGSMSPSGGWSEEGFYQPWEPVPFMGSCWECQEIGHIARYCPLRSGHTYQAPEESGYDGQGGEPHNQWVYAEGQVDLSGQSSHQVGNWEGDSDQNDYPTGVQGEVNGEQSAVKQVEDCQ